MIHLTDNIKAAELPKDARSIFIDRTNSYGDKNIWFLTNESGKLESKRIFLDVEPEQHIELLGVIQNGEITDTLAIEYCNHLKWYWDKEQTQEVPFHPEKYSVQVLRDHLKTAGIDLSKTVVIIKTK